LEERIKQEKRKRDDCWCIFIRKEEGGNIRQGVH